MPAPVLLINPRKRRRHRHKAKAHRRIRRNPAVHRARSSHRRKRRRSGFSGFASGRFRRNPSMRSAGGLIGGTLMPAAIGAAGAVGVRIALGVLPLPDALKTSTMAPFVRSGIAIGLGILVGKFLRKPALGKALAIGGLTVVGAEVATDFIKSNVPSLPLGDGADFPLIEYQDDGMGQLVPIRSDGGMGALIRTSDAFDGMGSFDDPEY